MPFLRVNINVSSMRLDNTVNRGQPKTGSLTQPLCCEEGFEDVLHGLSVHSYARICNGQQYVVPGFWFVELPCHILMGDISGFQEKISATGHGICRIYIEVPQGLLNLTLVCLYWKQIFGKFSMNRNFLFGCAKGSRGLFY
ncbi:hypothetical protein ES703_88480 [subsurface metagenome]